MTTMLTRKRLRSEAEEILSEVEEIEAARNEVGPCTPLSCALHSVGICHLP